MGGEVWCGDETTLREFPPLRATWARRGHQATVVISGRNGRRVLHGALNIRSGALVTVVRERNRGADVAALLQALGHTDPARPRLLLWDNHPAHRTKVVQEMAQAVGVELAWLPYRSPELNPCEDLWRPMKAQVAANRAHPQVDALAAQAMDWLAGRTPEERLRTAGLRSPKFHWLTT